MFRFHGTRTVRRELMGLVLLSALALSIILGVFVLKTRLDSREIAMIQTNDSLVETTSTVEALFLRARRAEKDFLLRKDEKYLALHAEILTELRAGIADLEAGATALTGEQNPNVEQLYAALAQYEDHFGQLRDLNLALGLSENDGLQGKLRDAVHGIEGALDEFAPAEMQAKMLMMRRHEKDFIMRVDQKYVDKLQARIAEFREFPASMYPSQQRFDEVIALLDTYQTAFEGFATKTLAEQDMRHEVSASFSLAEPVFETFKTDLNTAMEAQTQQVEKLGRLVMIAAFVVTAAVMVIFLWRILSTVRAVSGPLQHTSEAIEELAAGNLDVEPPDSAYEEISRIGLAFTSFRTSILENREREQKMREHEERERSRKAAEEREKQERREAEMLAQQKAQQEQLARDREITAEISEVVAACARGDFSQQLSTDDKEGGLAELCKGVNQITVTTNTGLLEVKEALIALSHGDLGHRMHGEFMGLFEDIRQSVNRTAESLSEIVGRIDAGSEVIDGSSHEVAIATQKLASRTEQNAATLEQTAAAIEELASSVGSSAEAADNVSRVVSEVKREADKSDDVLEQTTQAMRTIKDSSSKIGNIIRLIDDIAFQTNLLALNAGVEAARAGDAGKGFAVVASEVRDLAARSTGAAKEIAELIQDSSNQIDQGVSLVDQTADVLKLISGGVADVASRISEIALSAEEQRTTIVEINSAANRIDEATQQNAAMFEETAAATHAMQGEAKNLREIVREFNIEVDHKGSGASVVSLDTSVAQSDPDKAWDDQAMAVAAS
ncbi:MAG: methyl-accepting chemotaxis protein [Maritimibacter sp.]